LWSYVFYIIIVLYVRAGEVDRKCTMLCKVLEYRQTVSDCTMLCKVLEYRQTISI